MKIAPASIALAAVLMVAGSSAASAWTRHGTVTTPRGTYTGSASGGCAGGTCSRSATITGPYGRTVSRSGSISRTGPHSYSYSRTTTGPQGRSVTRAGTVHVYPY